MPLDKETAKHFLYVTEEIDRLWRYLGYGKDAEEARDKARKIREDVQKYKKEMQEVFKQQYEESSRYFTTIMTVGYAGYFATWTIMRGEIDKWHASFIGLMGITSLFTFICWELLSMFIRFRTLNGLNNLFRDMISVEDFESFRQEILAKEVKLLSILRPIWFAIFILSVGSAGAGAMDLGIQLYKNLTAIGSTAQTSELT